MNLLRFIPIKLTLVLILGILLGENLALGIVAPLVLTLLFLGLTGFLFYRKSTSILFSAFALLTTICIGMLSVAMATPENDPAHYSHQNFNGNHLWKLKIREVLKSTSFSDRYVAQVQVFENKKVAGKIVLNIAHDSTRQQLQVDDEFIVYATASFIKAPLNPHQFDYRHYLKGIGITRQMRIEADAIIPNDNSATTIYGLAASVRNHIIGKLKAVKFGQEELSIIQALLLGQRNDISTETYNNYKNAGAVHILAVSGLHIGIVLLLIQFVLRPLERFPKGKTLKLIVTVCLLWGFALLAGLSASVVRAVTMFSFVAYALYLNRPSNTFNILALSMFFILLAIDPLLLFQVGFQMSYAAVLAIVWLYPILQKMWYPKNLLIRKMWQLLSVSIAAQLGVLPISLFYFHQFPGLFFISNLLVVPALGLILGIGILIILLATANILPDFLVILYNTIIGWMNELVNWVAEQEAFIFRNISFDGLQIVFAYSMLVFLMLFLTKPNRLKFISLALSITTFYGYLFFTTIRTEKKDVLLLAHQTKNSILIHQQGSFVTAMATDTVTAQKIVTDYAVAERIVTVNFRPILNSYQWHSKNILVIDSLAVYPKTVGKPTDYLLLTQSPRMNLERLIDSLLPKRIIADGSNYSSYVTRWKKTCEKRKLPFHYTGEKGAFFFNPKEN